MGVSKWLVGMLIMLAAQICPPNVVSRHATSGKGKEKVGGKMDLVVPRVQEE